jgi:hypothetical protein
MAAIKMVLYFASLKVPLFLPRRQQLVMMVPLRPLQVP